MTHNQRLYVAAMNDLFLVLVAVMVTAHIITGGMA